MFVFMDGRLRGIERKSARERERERWYIVVMQLLFRTEI